MMFNVVLVDDEDIDLEGLRYLIPWERFDMQVVGAFNNSEYALNFLKTNSADVLVTDIRMPHLTGLELAQSAKQWHPHLEIIIISGHEDFYQAKQAMSIGASRYVLKPVDDEELINVLSGSSAKLHQHKQQSQLLIDYENARPYRDDQLLRSWFKGTADSAAIDLLLHQRGIRMDGEPYIGGIIEMDDLGWKLNHYEDNERQRMVNEITDFLSDRLRSFPFVFYSSLEWHRIAFIAKHLDETEYALKKLIEQIRIRYPISITVGLGNNINNQNEVSCSIGKAEEALTMKMFLGKGIVIDSSKEYVTQRREAVDLHNRMKEMLAATARYELVAIDDCLKQFSSHIYNLDTKVSVYHFALHIMSQIDSWLHTFHGNLYEMLDWEREKMDVIFNFETVEDIVSWLRRKLFELSEKLHMRKKVKNRKLADEVKEHINSCLHQPLVLKEVAERFAISPNYLGQLFKDATNEGFQDYVNRTRLELACRLLEDPTNKIYEVAARVGFKNVTYFNYQFRTRFGISPSDFRKQRE